MAEETKLYRCCGCGLAARDLVKPCDCPTQVGALYRDGERTQYAVFTSATAARRMALSNLIKERLLGVPPDGQDLELEDAEWAEIVAALEGS